MTKEEIINKLEEIKNALDTLNTDICEGRAGVVNAEDTKRLHDAYFAVAKAFWRFGKVDGI